VVLFDPVVQVFRLTKQDVRAGVRNHRVDCRRVGTALVDGDADRQVVKVDGALEEAPGRCQIALGGEQEVHRVAVAVDGPVQILPLAGHQDVGLIHAPA